MEHAGLVCASSQCGPGCCRPRHAHALVCVWTRSNAVPPGACHGVGACMWRAAVGIKKDAAPAPQTLFCMRTVRADSSHSLIFFLALRSAQHLTPSAATQSLAMDDPTPSRRMTRGLSRALSSLTATGAASAGTPKATAVTGAARPTPLGERTNTAAERGTTAPKQTVSAGGLPWRRCGRARAAATESGKTSIQNTPANPLSHKTQQAFSPLLPGAETTPPLRLAPSALASPPRQPFAAEVQAVAGPAPPSASVPPGLLRTRAAVPPPPPPRPPPASLADLLASPYTPIGDDGEVVGASSRQATPASIPAHWPRQADRAAAARAYGLATAVDAVAAGPSHAFPTKATVARAPTPEEAATDRAGVAALQAEVRRALASVGVSVPLSSSRRAGGAGGDEDGGSAPPATPAATPAPAPMPAPRRLTTLEAALGGLGLGTPLSSGVSRRNGRRGGRGDGQ